MAVATCIHLTKIPSSFPRYLPACGHSFHCGCVDVWLGSNASCPNCRQLVLPAWLAEQQLVEQGQGQGREHGGQQGQEIWQGGEGLVAAGLSSSGGGDAGGGGAGQHRGATGDAVLVVDGGVVGTRS